MRERIFTLKAILFFLAFGLLHGLDAGAKQSGTRNKSNVVYRNSYQRVTCGTEYTIEIRGGTLWGWGANSFGQLGIGNNTAQNAPVQIGNGNSWVTITAGSGSTLAIKADGTLWAWGYNLDGELGIGNTINQNSPVQVGTDNKWISVCAGQYHVLALKADGTLWAWGNNVSGDLGIGNTLQQNSPVQVGAGTNWVAVAAGNNHSSAIKSDGTLWSWGYNGYGALGIGNNTDQYSPVQVGAGNTWATISSQYNHSVAIQSNGTLWSWGSNQYGQLGIGNIISQNSPVQVGAQNTWVSVEAGWQQSMGTKADGTLWSWGFNNNGQLGIGNTTDQNAPVQVGAGNTWVKATASSGAFTMALKADGTLWAFGQNLSGQLGIGNNTGQLSPVQTSVTLSEWLTIAGGDQHTLAIKTNGTLWAWGRNNKGQLGIGNMTDQLIPVQVGNGTTWIAVVGGSQYSLGIKADGTLWAWGYNFDGQLGIGNNTDQNVPVQVGAGNNWVNVSCAFHHAIAIKSDGTLWIWGDNSYGQLGTGNLINQNAPVQIGVGSTWLTAVAGNYQSAALKSDGTIWSWGSNFSGQLGIGNNTNQLSPVQAGVINSWTDISMCYNAMNAIRSNGTLWSTGENGNGELGIGNNTSQTSFTQAGVGNTWVDVSTGIEQTIALKADGTLWACGYNIWGMLGIGNNTDQNSFTQAPSISNVIQLQATGSSAYHSAIIKSTRDMVCLVGFNGTGELGDGTTVDRNIYNCITACAPVTPTISIAANPGNTICAGTPVTFTATITNGGASPTYVWKKNNVVVGTNSSTYTDNALVNGDIVTCTLTSNATCASPATVTSNSITITVNPVLVPTISITANPAGPICAGTSVTFTATITNGGASPIYVWKKNNVVVGTNSTTYTDNALVNGDVITCTLTSNATCASPATVTSNSITITVNAVLVPTINITANPAGAICAGTPVTFTATITNGGASPTYVWKKNNVVVGTNSSTYTDNALVNGDVVTCTLTSNATCANPTTVTSNSITITVNPVLVPTISITANPAGPICAGTSVTFTAAITNGGASPTYVWKKNNVVVGTNSSTYTDNALVNGDVITCTLTSNATCASPTTVTSSGITMTVNPTVIPTVNITANPAGAICAGTSVTFTATMTNGGPSPTYQWYNGATIVGTNQNTYTNNGLANGDIITCVLTSNATCASPAAITSNADTMIVNPVLTPSIVVTANPGDSICTGNMVTFTATATNGGPAPIYQWTKNANPVGSNLATYSDNLLNDGDVVACTLTSNATCVNPATVSSSNHTIVWNSINALAGTAGNTETNALLLTGPAVDVRYTDCDLMATITPAGANPVGGNTTVKVTIDNAVNSYNTQPYVQRHFDIEPANNAANATATIKLYAYQAEFDAFNTTAGPLGYPLLPTGGVDNGNVRITQFHGTGTAPGNYSGTEEYIVPAVSWDNAHGWWVMTFSVSGFSGFYIHTDIVAGPLAVNEPTDISAVNVGAKNRVDWYTQNENPGDVFTLQRSADGTNFTTLTNVPGKGRAYIYTYWDEEPLEGVNYYRVMLRNAAGQVNYTKTVTANVQQQTGLVVEANPNPVLSNVTVTVHGPTNGNGYVSLMDVAGKTLVKVRVRNNAATIDMSALAQGLYMLRYNDDKQTKTVRVSKY